MRIAVAGATGHIGALTVAALERDGHEVVSISRALGVDLFTGEGLHDALAGVEALIDSTSAAPRDADEAVEFFGTVTRNLLAAEHEAGVGHHVLLSIVGIHRFEGNPHCAGKREQERLIEAGPVPWTIVPATQFHDFAAMVTSWTEHDGVATIAPLLVQPIAPADIADVLAEVATDEPQGRYRDGHHVQLVPTWSGPLDVSWAGNVLLPGEPARLATTTFDDWLAAGAAP
jgi:uncharacterized protein YbjT (DUF2867 family)